MTEISPADLDLARDRLRHQDPEPDRLLSADEAASMLQVSAWQVRRWAVERHIPAIKLGRFWRFRRSSLQAWLGEQERSAR